MAKRKVKDGRVNNGGARVGSGPRVAPENRKVQANFGFKKKLLDSPEKLLNLKTAVYQFVENVYEKEFENKLK